MGRCSHAQIISRGSSSFSPSSPLSSSLDPSGVIEIRSGLVCFLPVTITVMIMMRQPTAATIAEETMIAGPLVDGASFVFAC